VGSGSALPVPREGEAVGALGHPATGGRFTADRQGLQRPVLVVDEPVMETADKGEVVDVGGAVVSGPEPEVMRLTVRRRTVARREHAAAISDQQEPPLSDVGVAAGAGEVDGLTGDVHDREGQVGVAAEAGKRLDGEFGVGAEQLAVAGGVAEYRCETSAGQPRTGSAAQTAAGLRSRCIGGRSAAGSTRAGLDVGGFSGVWKKGSRLRRGGQDKTERR
jgi:hypothetical protein